METPSIPDRIVHAALQLINEHGLGGVSMTSVAEGAGIARQTLYNHYSDVDTIVAGAIRRHNEEAIEQLESAIKVVETPSARIEQLIRHVAATSAHHGQILATPTLSRDSRETLAEYDAALDELLRKILDDGRKAGEFRSDLVVAVDAVIVRHLLEGVSGFVVANPGTAAETVAASTRTVMAALRQL